VMGTSFICGGCPFSPHEEKAIDGGVYGKERNEKERGTRSLSRAPGKKKITGKGGSALPLGKKKGKSETWQLIIGCSSFSGEKDSRVFFFRQLRIAAIYPVFIHLTEEKKTLRMSSSRDQMVREEKKPAEQTGIPPALAY